jgi:hypothetical protein
MIRDQYGSGGGGGGGFSGLCCLQNLSSFVQWFAKLLNSSWQLQLP